MRHMNMTFDDRIFEKLEKDKAERMCPNWETYIEILYNQARKAK